MFNNNNHSRDCLMVYFRRICQTFSSTDGGTWYLQACKFLKLEHHINSSYEKSIIERAMQYIRDRTECFDDYFSMQKKRNITKAYTNWFRLFVYHYNREVIS